MRKERRSAGEIVAAMEEARRRMDLHGLHHLKKEFTDLVLEEDRRDKEVRRRGVLEGEAMASSMGTEHGEVVMTVYDPPLHLCQAHGMHPRWISLYGYGAKMPAYCMDCIVALLEREKVGKVMLEE